MYINIVVMLINAIVLAVVCARLGYNMNEISQQRTIDDLNEVIAAQKVAIEKLQSEVDKLKEEA